MILHGVENIDRSQHKLHPELRVIRMAVPGGWLYITFTGNPTALRPYDERVGDPHASAFVPDPSAEHVLRAAQSKAEKG